jgi:putative thiamine transport system permease protein
MIAEGRALRLAVLLAVLGGLALPVLAGLAETLRAAFGILPAIGARPMRWRPGPRWRRTPGSGRACG